MKQKRMTKLTILYFASMALNFHNTNTVITRSQFAKAEEQRQKTNRKLTLSGALLACVIATRGWLNYMNPELETASHHSALDDSQALDGGSVYFDSNFTELPGLKVSNSQSPEYEILEVYKSGVLLRLPMSPITSCNDLLSRMRSGRLDKDQHPFAETCSECEFASNDTIACHCQRFDGYSPTNSRDHLARRELHEWTTINLGDNCQEANQHRIVNCAGHLSKGQCTECQKYESRMYDKQDTPYTESCRDCKIEGQNLECSCQTIDGAYVEARVDLGPYCSDADTILKGPLHNLDGQLKHVRGQLPYLGDCEGFKKEIKEKRTSFSSTCSCEIRGTHDQYLWCQCASGPTNSYGMTPVEQSQLNLGPNCKEANREIHNCHGQLRFDRC